MDACSEPFPVLAPPTPFELAWPAWPAERTREPCWRRWSRRGLSFTLWGVAWVLGSVGLLLLPLVGLLDGVTASRWARCRGWLAVWIYSSCEVAGLAASAALWLARPLATDSQWVAWNAALQRRWVHTLLGALRAVYGLTITVEGAPLTDPGPLLVLARHTSLVDTLLPLRILDGWRLRYVLKHELLWDPCLDVVGQRIPNAFVRRSSGDTDAEAAKIRELVTDLRAGEGAVLFPEGTRFTPAKRARVVAALDRRGDAEAAARARRLRHLLPPRRAGAEALLGACPRGGVLFVAHTGLEHAQRLASLTNGALIGKTIRVRVRHVPAEEVPRTGEALHEWLDAAWAELDDWIEGACEP